MLRRPGRPDSGGHVPPRPTRRLNDLGGRLWRVLWRRAEVSRPTYVAWAAALSLTLSGAAVVAYWLVVTRILGLGTPPAPPEVSPHLLEMLVGWVLLAPVGETVLLVLVVGIARAFTDRELWHVVAGAVPLGVVHGFQGVTAYDAGGHAFVSVISFVVFSLVYVAWRRSSLREAFWMCAAVHMIHNFVLVLVVLVDQAWRSGGPPV
jgi:hypothetical protein